MTEAMRQLSEHRWSLESPAEVPMRGHCPTCQRSVVVRQPRVVDNIAGRYVVEGECEHCGGAVRLQVP